MKLFLRWNCASPSPLSVVSSSTHPGSDAAFANRRKRIIGAYNLPPELFTAVALLTTSDDMLNERSHRCSGKIISKRHDDCSLFTEFEPFWQELYYVNDFLYQVEAKIWWKNWLLRGTLKNYVLHCIFFSRIFISNLNLGADKQSKLCKASKILFFQQRQH